MALGLLGLILATSLIGWFGFKDILRATLSVGVPGFLAVCAFQTALFVLLGLCWYVLLPALPLWLAIWGRMVRDASGQLLPLSLVGGFVFGTRAVSFFGVPAPQAIASTVVDLTAEFLAQIGLVAIGLVLLAARTPGARLILPVGLGLIACLGIGAAFIWLQRRQESPVLRLSHMLLGRTIPGLDHELVAVQHALAAIYAAPWRVAWSTALHLLAWFGTGFASYLAFRLLGARIDFASALGIEALLHAMLAGAILVPGYAGVQEAAYAAVGVLFGQPPALALAVSLLRRARDVALGVPILLLWQGMELKRRREAAPRIAG